METFSWLGLARGLQGKVWGMGWSWFSNIHISKEARATRKELSEVMVLCCVRGIGSLDLDVIL